MALKSIRCYLHDLDLPSLFFLQHTESLPHRFLSMLYIEQLIFFRWHRLYIFSLGLCKRFLLAILQQQLHFLLWNQQNCVFLPLNFNPAFVLMWCWICPHLCRCVISWPITATAVRWSPARLKGWEMQKGKKKLRSLTQKAAFAWNGIKRNVLPQITESVYLPYSSDVGRRFHSRALQQQAAYCLSWAGTANQQVASRVFIWSVKDALLR